MLYERASNKISSEVMPKMVTELEKAIASLPETPASSAYAPQHKLKPVAQATEPTPEQEIQNWFRGLTHREMKTLAANLWATKPAGKEAIELADLPDMFDQWCHGNN